MTIEEKAAQIAGKKASEFRVEEFENENGGHSAALVSNSTGSIVIQSNSGRKALEQAVDAGNLVFLDPGVPPKQKDGVPREDAARVTDGYGTLNETTAPMPQMEAPEKQTKKK
jgi:hypothetical protein